MVFPARESSAARPSFATNPNSFRSFASCCLMYEETSAFSNARDFSTWTSPKSDAVVSVCLPVPFTKSASSRIVSFVTRLPLDSCRSTRSARAFCSAWSLVASAMATARPSGRSPCATRWNNESSRLASATPLRAVASPRDTPCSCSLSAVIPVSRMNFAASIEDPLPSAMLVSAPMDRAPAASFASMCRTAICLASVRRASSNRWWPLTT